MIERKQLWHEFIYFNFFFCIPRCRFEVTQRVIKASIQHHSGRILVSVTSDEPALAGTINTPSSSSSEKSTTNKVQKQMRLTNVNAARQVGRILAHRCQQAGIQEVFFDQLELPVQGWYCVKKFCINVPGEHKVPIMFVLHVSCVNLTCNVSLSTWHCCRWG